MEDLRPYSLGEKRAIVCGASQGIGRACAERFARLGAEVTLVARSESALQQACDDLPADMGQRHRYIPADFRDHQALESKITQHLAQTGPVQILLNNTGGPPHGPIVDVKPEAFLEAATMHVLCNQVLVQAVLPGMKQAGYGRIINIISISVKEPIKGLGVSNTTRWAVAAWAKTMAGELGPFGITVNNVLPGYTATSRLDELAKSIAATSGITEEQVRENWVSQVPLGRLAGPDEIAAAAAFLASPAASYVNGINLPVDGGRSGSL
ncbi:MAG: SDR family oxidoreductase [Planctomycetota bacterium]